MSNPIRPFSASPAAPPRNPMFRALAIAASGLSAQRERMEVIASNIANAETTHGPNGAYRRRVAVLAAGDAMSSAAQSLAPEQPTSGATSVGGADPFDASATRATTDAPRRFQIPVLETNDAAGAVGGVHVAAVQEDATEGELVYDPGHPDADKNGYVRYPNVRITDEIVDMMDARRVYEANATVFQSAKAMLRRALDI